MMSIIIGSLALSLLHAVIPNHWLPVLAIGRREKWTLSEVTIVTLYAALAHALSTVLLGVLLSFLGLTLAGEINQFTRLIAPAFLILLGIYFINRHHRHKHFHVNAEVQKKSSKKSIIIALTAAMFLSPCMEIEAYFLLAGAEGWWLVAAIAVMYLIITVTGMVLLVRFAYTGLLRLNWHALEHNAGIITGITLVLTGIISFFIN